MRQPSHRSLPSYSPALPSQTRTIRRLTRKTGVRAFLNPFAPLTHPALLVTYSLEGMRQALLAGASFAQMWPSVRSLIIFAVILLPLSGAIDLALRQTKITGRLTHL